MPVEAASKAPTIDTEIPKPALTLPRTKPIVSRSSSANFDLSNITPIKINNGTAISKSLVIIP